MDWYYGQNGQQVGPIGDAQLDELRTRGDINDTTLVWHQGMDQWQPLQAVRPSRSAPLAPNAPLPTLEGRPLVMSAPPAGLTATCAECRRLLPQTDMVLLNRSWVCAACKPIFVQRLKEGVGPAGGLVWRENRQLVIRHDTPLPDRCIKCNAPAHGGRLQRKLSWHPSAVYLLLLINLLVYAIVALVVRKRATVNIGLCELHRKRRLTIIIGSWTAVVVGFALLLFGGQFNYDGLLGLGFLVLIGGAIVGLLMARQVAAAKIDKEYVWVTGVCREYLADLPEWNGPQ